MKLMTTSITLLVVFWCCDMTRAEVPRLSSDELKNDATDIVVGKVRDVYSITKQSKNWEDTRWVAEIAVSHVEKGTAITICDVVYAHYWNKRWIGNGLPGPHSSGHDGVNKDDLVRAHLSHKDGTYQVLLPNGFAKVDAEKVKEVSFVLSFAEVLVKSNEPEANAAVELARVQGKWARTITTDNGKLKVVKEHIGNKTSLTFFDPAGNVVAAKTSEFRLENTGRVRIFTFFNNVITAGPQKGQIDKASKSYIYRITGDTFFEANGFLIDNGDEPLAYSWTRVK